MGGAMSIVILGSTSGSITLQEPAVAGTTVLDLPATSGTLITTGSTTGINASAISTGVVPQANGGTGTTTGFYNFKNRIINGAMQIDQRNAGASVNTNNSYPVDRYQYQNDSDATLTLQQSSTAPAGFTNSIQVTISTADSSVGSSQYAVLTQRIEGFNIADLGWGTANAQTVTLSFWVRSSVTGTYGGVVNNNGSSRSYPYTYTINSANTWEYKTVTISGDTSGTWLTNNGVGIQVRWAFGMGSSLAGTAGSWSGSTFFGATGAVNLISTLNATWNITGVQLEVGSTATSFDYRPYGTELQLCRRYTQVYRSSTNGIIFPNGWYQDGNNIRFIVMFDQEMRAACSVSFFGTANTDYLVMDNATGQSGFTFGAEQFGTRSVVIQANKNSHGITNKPNVNLYIATSNTGGFICSSEL